MSDELFYKSYNGDFAGDIRSHEIIGLSEGFLRGDVLDVGAGSGKAVSLLDELPSVKSVSAIDIAPKNSRIIEASIDKIPYPNESFDCIICTEVLEHLDKETMTAGLNEIYRVLRKKGNVIITVPYKENLSKSTTRCPHCNKEFHIMGHKQSLSPMSLNNSIVRAGLFVEKFKIIPLAFCSGHKYLKHIFYYSYYLKNLPIIRNEPLDIFMIASKGF